MINVSRVGKVLVIKLRATGDVVLSTIVMANLRQAFPNATLWFLTERASAGVLKGNPFIDQLFVFDRKTMSSFDVLRAVRRERFDLVLDLFGNPRTALITKVSGAPYRVGYRFRGRTYAYNIVAEPRGGQVHNTQFNLDALEAAGIPVVDRSLHISIPDEDVRMVDTFLAPLCGAGTPLVAMNIGGGWYTKRWGLEKFAALGDLLSVRYGAGIVLPWGPGELSEVQQVAALMNHAPCIPPATSLLQLAALLRRCVAVVSNDSGPMHIAAAVGTPVLAIFGPTNPLLQGPYGENHGTVRNEVLDCLGCNLTRCPIGLPCMLALQVEPVLRAFDALAEKIGLAAR